MTDPIAAIGAVTATDRALLEALAQIAASSATSAAHQSNHTSRSRGHHENVNSNIEHAKGQSLLSNAEETNALHSMTNNTQPSAGLRVMARDTPFTANTTSSDSGLPATMETATSATVAATVTANPTRHAETLLPPATVTPLHITPEQSFRKLNNLPSKKDRLHNRWRSSTQTEDDRNQQEAYTEERSDWDAPREDSTHEIRDQKSSLHATKIAAEHGAILFLRLKAKLQASNCEASHSALLELTRERRVLVAFPAKHDDALQSMAEAYLIWQTGDLGKAVRIHARLYWANTKRTQRFIGVRVRKDCNQAGQRILKPEIEKSINPEGAAILTTQSLAQVRWTEAALVISEAVRLWSLVGQQWSMGVLLATAPHYDFPGVD